MNSRKITLKCKAITNDTIHNLIGVSNLLRGKAEYKDTLEEIDNLIRHFDKSMQKITKELQK